MAKKFFVTGTDTEVGKTFISCAILEKAKQQGLATGALKPIAAGGFDDNGTYKNEDAVALSDAMTLNLPYQSINPILLKDPIAPHIAAEQEGKKLSASRLHGFVQGAFLNRADLWLVEGAGGWFVPLNQRETLADFAVQLNVPIILVVGIRLGCLNHALLTIQAIMQSGLPLAGWVANCIDPQAQCIEENIETLKSRIRAPLLGVVPQSDSAQNAAQYISLDAIM